MFNCRIWFYYFIQLFLFNFQIIDCKPKLNKETLALNDTLDQMDLTDIFKTFHLKGAEYTCFSRAHGTFSRIDHILGHKSALNKQKKIEIIPCIFSDHNAMKLEINHKKIWKGNKYLEAKEHPTKERMG